MIQFEPRVARILTLPRLRGRVGEGVHADEVIR